MSSWTSARTRAAGRCPCRRPCRGGHVYAFEALPYYARVLKNVVALLRRTERHGDRRRRFGQTRPEVDIVWKDADGHRLTGKTHMSATADLDERCVFRR